VGLEADNRIAPRRQPQARQRLGADYAAVFAHRQRHGVVAQRLAGVAVFYFKQALASIRQRAFGRLVHALAFVDGGPGLAVRFHDAFDGEVVVVLLLKVAAVGVIRCASGIALQQSLVFKLPDAAANHALGGAPAVPKLLHVAGGVAHGVGVFAEENGPRVAVVLVGQQLGREQAGVHAAHHVHVGLVAGHLDAVGVVFGVVGVRGVDVA
nr:hypothetical protein [Tanacetum cinerariifolium]